MALITKSLKKIFKNKWNNEGGRELVNIEGKSKCGGVQTNRGSACAPAENRGGK